ncbi:hypothetical protein GGS23DRAFT_596500 [Durotheca rogersii]|uniref:uncharacterized protein n=1 Tax=Durotheca rogersii TaxID=419775 RepID=UPI002221147F|nr:uncharacterized protein GGS23DRAFT_596500 [Durotheca rogersii]KAI5863313.1 hypothetical protein GGS23DRAFT_596500 [Durotheca rogersii]
MSMKIGPIRRAWYQWKTLRLPWRKRFLVGLDLQGNTYWEFRLGGGGADAATASGHRYRRIVEYPQSTHYSDVVVSPPWHQWLRYQREKPPTHSEQAAEVARQERIKVLAAEADARWAAKPSYLSPPHLSGKPNIGHAASPLDTGETHPWGRKQEPMAPGSPAQHDLEAETQATPTSDAPPKSAHDPWKHAQGAPGETWQPEAWSPASAKKR